MLTGRSVALDHPGIPLKMRKNAVLRRMRTFYRGQKSCMFLDEHYTLFLLIVAYPQQIQKSTMNSSTHDG